MSKPWSSKGSLDVLPTTLSIIALIVALTLAATSPALGAERGSELLPIIDFELFIQHYDTDLDHNGETFDTTIDKVGIRFFEQTGRYVQGGLTLGWLQLSQDDNPTMQGVSPWGGFLGVALRSDPVDSHRTRVRAQAEYAYHVLDDDSETQDTELEWHQATLELAGTLKFSQLHLTLGGRSRWIDGEETASGTITQNRSLKQDTEASGYIGLDLIVQETSRLGIYGETGAREGFTLSFGRRF